MFFKDDVPYGRFEYECDDEGLMVKLPGVFGNDRYPLHYALGSGTHAVTFLSIIPSATGQTVGIEHRWSWFADGARRGVTPGQAELLPTQEVDYFGMVFKQELMERCVGCHTTTFEVRNHALVNVQPNVNCEACHGPAEKHVTLARAKQMKDAVAAIEVHRPGPAEMALCGRCHRTAEQIDSDRLKRYPRSLVRFQPVGLVQSRCFKKSDGRLSCSTCHDPHQSSSARTPVSYDDDCRKCHASPGKSACPVSPQTDCVRCHMPSIELAAGLRFHDHWIRIRPENDPALQPLNAPADSHSELGQPRK